MFASNFVAFGDRSVVPLHSVSTNVGSADNRTFVEGVDVYGPNPLRETKPIDRYAYIQSFASSVDIKALMARYSAGEVDVLNRVDTVFDDFTRYPSDLLGAFDLLSAARSDFEALPVDVRAEFGHDFRAFLRDAGSPEWIRVVSRGTADSDTSVKDGDSVEP